MFKDKLGQRTLQNLQVKQNLSELSNHSLS